jgi:hypothetical protein
MNNVFVAFREALVLLLGFPIAASIPMVCTLFGIRLEPLPEIVAAMFFCLGRAAFVPRCPDNSTAFRRVLYQVLRAFALIVLMLFEVEVGLCFVVKDIPNEAWAFIGSVGAVYIIFVCLAESMLTADTAEYTINCNDDMRRE